jgi:hypothetical protein
MTLSAPRRRGQEPSLDFPTNGVAEMQCRKVFRLRCQARAILISESAMDLRGAACGQAGAVEYVLVAKREISRRLLVPKIAVTRL